jgi:serine/threonine-protein kinase
MAACRPCHQNDDQRSYNAPTPVTLAPGSLLGAYQVIGPLGAGGMGEVALALDTRLGRRVALKSVLSDAAGTPEARRRMLREARAIASLTHPNIAAIYDVLEIEDAGYIVMEYVEGQTLSARLREGALPPADALALASQLAATLAFAHARGIVHRDLKPGNLILTPEGTLKVLDFGLARVGTAATGDDNPTLTQHTYSGQMVGTPGYSAPEQLIGVETDHRADIYGVGVVLFEMLTGRRAFVEKSQVERVAAAVAGEVPSARSIDGTIPIAVEQVIARAMARQPSARYQSAAELAAALRAAADAVAPTVSIVRPARHRHFAKGVVAVVALLLAGSAAVWRFTAPSAGSSPVAAVGLASVAVLPLDNLSGDTTREFVGVGMAETISTSLAAMPALVVVSPAEVRRSQAAAATPALLAAKLGVAYVVGGSVQQAGEQLGVNLQLLDASGRVMWAERFEGRLADLFDLQRRMADGIGAALRVNTDAAAPAAVAAAAAATPAALAAYWQGRILLDERDRAGNVERAVEAFQRAISTDTSLALAHAGLGEAYWALYAQTKDPEFTQRAIAAGLDAIRLAPDEPQAHYTLAVIYQGSGRIADATDELRRVQALRPNHVDAPRLLGSILAEQGRVDDAIAEFNKAIALRPNYAENYSQLGVVLYNASRFTEAEPVLKRVAELSPDSPRGFQQLGTLYQAIGDQARALDAYQKSVARNPYALTFSNIGTILYAQGRFAEAADAYQQALALSPNRPVPHRNLGDAYLRLGRTADARAAYQRALDLTAAELRVNPKDAQNLSRLAVYEAKLGRSADAERHLAEAAKLAPGDGAVLFRASVVYALGKKPAPALQSLKDAIARGYAVAVVKADDDLASLRSLPAFQALVQEK